MKTMLMSILNQSRIQTPAQQENGFTIIEFIIASFVFSIILLLLTGGLIKLSRTYFEGIVASQTQDTARNIVDAVSQPLQFNGDNFVQLADTGPGDSVHGFCVGTKRFSFILANPAQANTQSTLAAGSHVLLEDDVSKLSPSQVRCTNSTLPLDVTTPNPGPSGGPYIELMSANMWLNKLQVCQVSTNLFNVNVRVLYGPVTPSLFNDDLQSTSAAGCGTVPTQLYKCAGDNTGDLGSEFCAVSELDTVVEQRVVPN